MPGIFDEYTCPCSLIKHVTNRKYRKKLHNGWWKKTYPSEKYEFVSWDDDIPFPTFHGKSVKIPMVPVTTKQKFYALPVSSTMAGDV